VCYSLQLCSSLGDENSDAAILHVHAGCVCPVGHRFPTPVIDDRRCESIYNFLLRTRVIIGVKGQKDLGVSAFSPKKYLYVQKLDFPKILQINFRIQFSLH